MSAQRSRRTPLLGCLVAAVVALFLFTSLTVSVIDPGSGYETIRGEHSIMMWTEPDHEFIVFVTLRSGYSTTTTWTDGRTDSYYTPTSESYSQSDPGYGPYPALVLVPAKVIDSRPPVSTEYSIPGIPDPLELTDGSNAGADADALDGKGAESGTASREAGTAVLDRIELTEEQRTAIEFANRVLAERDGLEARAPAVGDPVLVGSGRLLSLESDFALVEPLAVERTYRSGDTGSGSLGPGWALNLDSRLVFGQSPLAADLAEEAEQTAAALRTPGSPERRDVDEHIASVDAGLRAVLVELDHAMSELDRSISGIDAFLASNELPPEAVSAFEARKSVALGKRAAVEAHRTKALAVLERLRTVYAAEAEAELEAAARKIDAIALELRVDAELSAVHAARNAGHLDAPFTAPAAALAAGARCVSLIETDGSLVVFAYAMPPSPDPARYANGERNHYPAGTALVSSTAGYTLALEPDGAFRLEHPDQTTRVYGFHGELLRIEDRNAVRTAFRYGGGVLLESIADRHGRTVRFDRDAAGRIVTATAGAGGDRVATGYHYDEDGRLAAVVDSMDRRTEYRYSAGGELVGIVHPDGSSRRYGYERIDGRTRVIWTEDEEGFRETFAHDRTAAVTHTNPSGVRTTHHLDDRYRASRVDHPGGLWERFDYSRADDLVYHRAPDGTVTRYAYDAGRNLTRVDYHDGTFEAWRFGSPGLPQSFTSRRGLATSYAYDGRGNLLRIDHPDGTADRFSYEPAGSAAAGEVSEHIDRRGNATRYRYDARGDLESVSDGEGTIARFARDAWGRVVEAIDPAGAVTRIEWRTDGLVAGVTRSASPGTPDPPEPIHTVYRYDDRGNLAAVTENGRRTEFAWDRRHLLLAITTPVAEQTRYEYRADGLPVAHIILSAPGSGGPPPEGRLASRTGIEYDDRGLIRVVRGPVAGTVTRYEHDDAGRVSAIVDPTGARVEYEYTVDGLPRVRTRFLDGRPIRELRDYYPGGLLRREVDARGFVTTWEHDPIARRLVERPPNGTAGTVTSLDPYGLPLRVTDPAGVTRRFDYDRRGRLVEVHNDLFREAAYAWDAADRLVRYTDGEGALWQYDYDAFGRIVRVTGPDGGVYRQHYKSDGTLAQAVDETGRATRYEYDADGRLVAVVEGADGRHRTEFSRHYLGGVESITDPTGRTIRQEFDAAGRVIAVIDPAGEVTRYAFDPASRTSARIDPTGRSVVWEWDALGRLASTEAGPLRSFYRYDDDGNLTEERNGTGVLRRYDYDALRRVVRETDRVGTSRTFAYDGAGRVVRVIDFNGSSAHYDYDRAGGLAGIRYQDGSYVEWEHDRAGRVLGVRNEVDHTVFTYTAAGAVATTRGSATGTDLSYRYDAAGRLASRANAPAGVRTDYRYDDRGLLAAIDDTRSGSVSIQRDAAGRPTAVRTPDGTVTATDYDAAGRVAATVARNANGTVLAGTAYVYDPAGRRVYDVDERGAISGYEYDAAGRLVRAEYPLAGPKKEADAAHLSALGMAPGAPAGRSLAEYLRIDSGRIAAVIDAYRLIHPLRKGDPPSVQQVWAEEFEYDAAGNRAAWRTAFGTVPYTVRADGRLGTAGATVYDHDVAGNLVAERSPAGETTYEYDARNRLSLARASDATVRYQYDGLGRLAFRTVTPEAAPGSLRKDAGTVTAVRSAVQYDGAGFTVAARVEIEFVVAASIEGLTREAIPASGRYRPAPETALNGIAASRTVWTEVAAGDLVVAVTGPDGTVCLSHDLLGSVRLATRAGAPEVRYGYDAFGSMLAGSPTSFQPYGYTGKPIDGVTGLLDYGFRHYHPALGRFTTEDPRKDGVNWYLYVTADPLNSIDRWGLEAEAVRVRLDVTLTYVKSAQTLTLESHHYHNATLTATFTHTYPASNNIRERVPGVDTPVEFHKYRHYPEEFPDGTWQLTATAVSPDPLINRYVVTDATRLVQTYVPSATGEGYQPDEVVRGGGYLLHGGGYTTGNLYDPLGFNRYEDNTRGCIRLQNSDMEVIAAHVGAALATRGAAMILVGRQ